MTTPYQQVIREIAGELIGQDNWQDLLDTAVDGLRNDVLSILHLNKKGKPTKLDPEPVVHFKDNAAQLATACGIKGSVTHTSKRELVTCPKCKVLLGCPQFTCPSCGSHRLEEVMSDCTVSSEILEVGAGGDLEYAEQCNDGGVVDRYQCLNCGHKVDCDSDSEALAEALGVKDEEAKEP